MLYSVAPYRLDTINLAPADAVEEILQNVSIILSTPKGSIPLDRSFGVDQEFVDRPSAAAEALLIAAVGEAIEEFEPRAKVVSTTVHADASSPGKLIPIVEVEIGSE